MTKRLYRSNDTKVIGGVCGGLGEHFDIDPTWIRLLFVLLIFASGIGILAYIIGWIVIPRRPLVPVAAPAAEVPPPAQPAAKTQKHGPGFLPGIILIGLGLIFLLHRFFFWFDFEYIWPLILIGIGGALIYRAVAPATGEDRVDEPAAQITEVENGR
ncbi:MAG: PspC domain-containing protein [Candidatus Zixiibacteriota bacterium]